MKRNWNLSFVGVLAWASSGLAASAAPLALPLVNLGGYTTNKMTNYASAAGLTNWLNVKYQSIDEVIRDFSLPSVVVAGQVLTNKKYAEVVGVRDWRDYIVGFQSTEGLCLMIFKAQAGRPGGSFPYDYTG